MTDEPRRLTPAEIAAADLPDWCYVLGRLKALFRVPDFSTGQALVAELGSLTTDGRRPEVGLTDGDVVLALPGRPGLGVSAVDVEAAAAVSAAAARLGATAAPLAITQLELGLDTAAGRELAPFYAALLGAEVLDGEPVDPSGQVPTVWWQAPQDDEDHALPPSQTPQRWHFDVWVAPDAARSRLAAVLDAGGRLVSDAAAPSYWVVQDADGNRSCICTSAAR